VGCAYHRIGNSRVKPFDIIHWRSDVTRFVNER
jgi:hypothetical protein